MSEERLKGRPEPYKRQLTEAEILTWADAFFERHGRWPNSTATPVDEAPELTWRGVDAALQYGGRGLPGGSSLARLLASRMGRNVRPLRPPLSLDQILTWADAYREQYGRWPTVNSGRILGTADETWSGIDRALTQGLRGLTGGRSLARLLAERRGVVMGNQRPALNEESIFNWAEAYYRKHGRWPTPSRGPVPDVPGETWSGVDRALQSGTRGLPGGSSLSRLIRDRESRPGGGDPGPVKSDD